MHSNPNARLTQESSLRLIYQHLQERCHRDELPTEEGISLRCAYKWLSQFRSGAAKLADRRSVRRTQRRTLDPQQQQKAVELRHQRHHLRHIAKLLTTPFSTVARIHNRLGLKRSRNVEPKPPVQRYEQEHPGDLINIDVKELANFRKNDDRMTGKQPRSAGNEPMGCLPTTRRNATVGCTGTCQSVTRLGSTLLSETGHPSSASVSCSAEQ
jgi:hypothetical protein